MLRFIEDLTGGIVYRPQKLPDRRDFLKLDGRDRVRRGAVVPTNFNCFRYSSLFDADISEFLHERIVNLSCGCTEARYGTVFRMGGAIGMSNPLLKGKMAATNDDDRKTDVVLAIYLNLRSRI
jgi:hypothetical protein